MQGETIGTMRRCSSIREATSPACTARPISRTVRQTRSDTTSRQGTKTQDDRRPGPENVSGHQAARERRPDRAETGPRGTRTGHSGDARGRRTISQPCRASDAGFLILAALVADRSLVENCWNCCCCVLECAGVIRTALECTWDFQAWCPIRGSARNV